MMMISRHNRGFSLIELMIAMVLGLMISAGIFTVFSGNKRSSDLNTAMADMQENARFALNQLSSDIRMAGYQGCKDINSGGANILAVGAPTSNLDNTTAIGYIVSDAGILSPTPPATLPTTSPGNPIPNTHALMLQFGSSATFPLLNNVGGTLPDPTAPITVNITAGISSEPFNIQRGEFAIISNCTGSDLIKVSSADLNPVVAHTNPENIRNWLTHDYLADQNTKFMRFNSNIYYIGDTGSVSANGTMITGLYQQKLPYEVGNPPMLMISGVENLRILFGARTGTNALSFLTPGSTGLRPQDIASIRVGLLMVSENPITEQKDGRTYTLAGQAIIAAEGATATAGTHPRDRRYRQAFNTTVKIRNRRNPNN
ncbi:MAG: type IV pilus assembly protein PilW [Granulosicoccus sp.]|jgi:type IV pilus assembly protein PilW